VKINLRNELKGLSSDRKREISQAVSEKIGEMIANDLATGTPRSSVSGAAMSRLSKDYKKKKIGKGKGGKANLILDGDMLSGLQNNNGVESVVLKITASKQKKKAFNHITGDTLPKRQFLPNEGEAFRSGIMKEINKIIKDMKNGN
jgi:hypothetical protein